MNADERLDLLIKWWFANAAELLECCEAGNTYARDFDRALFALLAAPTPERLEAAEIALVELDADWGLK